MQRLGGMVIFLGVTACGGGDAPTTVQRADSAGIAIVTNRRSPEELPLRVVSAEPVFRIPRDPAADPGFYDVRSIAFLSGDRVAVGNNGSKSVAVFDSASLPVVRAGRDGEGPGEFRAVESVVALGDSLFVHDPVLRRITAFSASGEFGRTIDVRDLAPEQGWSSLLPLGTDLVLFGQGGIGGEREIGVFRNPEAVRRVTTAGTPVASYGEFPGTAFFIGNGVLGFLPFGARTFATTSDTVLIVGTAEGPELLFFNASAGLSRIVRWPDRPREVKQEDFEAYLERELQEIPEEQRGSFRAQVETLPFADRSPPYWGLIATPDGHVWIGDYPGPKAAQGGLSIEPRNWTVLNAEGELLERIRIPAGFDPLAFHGGWVWGVFRDDLGLESIRAYALDGP